jgi:hypothetical protein
MPTRKRLGCEQKTEIVSNERPGNGKDWKDSKTEQNDREAGNCNCQTFPPGQRNESPFNAADESPAEEGPGKAQRYANQRKSHIENQKPIVVIRGCGRKHGRSCSLAESGAGSLEYSLKNCASCQ